MRRFPIVRCLAFLMPAALFVVLLFVSRPSTEEKSDSQVPAGGKASGGGVSISAEASPFEKFEEWFVSYRKADLAGRAAFLDEWREVALSRRDAMEDLIRSDPKAALENSLSEVEREKLPPEIRDLVEEPFSSFGSMDVFPLCGPEGEHAVAEVHGKADGADSGQIRQGVRIEVSSEKHGHLDAYVYGTRADPLSRGRIPLQGIRLGQLAALHEDTFARVPDEEVTAMRKLYPVGVMTSKWDYLTAEPVGNHPAVALSGGRLHFFARAEHIDELNRIAAILEERIGENNGSQLLLTSRITLDHNPVDPPAIIEESEQMAAIASDTLRTAVVILIDFPDKPGTPIDPNTLQERFDGEVHDQVASMSYHKTGIDATVYPQVFRMSHNTDYYNGKLDGTKRGGELFDEAMAAANAAGITTNGNNHRCIIFKGAGMSYCGLATVGGSKVWLQCHGSKVIVHELGHNFGLGHSGFWSVTGADPVDPDGSSVEYGDNTDIMGGGGVPSGHFNVQGKNKLGWLEDGQRYVIGTGDSSGSYRIYRFDNEDTDPANSMRAIRITKGSSEYYWVGYRQWFMGANYRNYERGVQLHWQRPSQKKSWLIDPTPSTTKNDAGVPLGMTYSDPVAGIHITSLRRGGSARNQWIEVQVNVGAYSQNQNPFSQIHLPSRFPAGVNVPMGATAADPNEDTLSYFFDVGTGDVVGNDGTFAYRDFSWPSTGTQPVVLTVSDMKGGTYRAQKSISIESEIVPPTNIVATDGIYLDRVGISWTASSGAGSYAVFRGPVDDVHFCDEIGTTSGTHFDDMNASPETDYYYWVQALAPGASSTLAGGDAGSTTVGPPGVPGQFTVTKNVYTDRVLVNWAESPAAASYQVLRSPSSDIGEAGIVMDGTASYFSDTTALPGMLYYYWVRAVNAAGTATTSAESGSRKLSAPTGLSASDGDVSGNVLLSWDGLAGADGYRVYRSGTSGGAGTAVGNTVGTTFTDSPPNAIDSYYYAVAGYSIAGGEGEKSSTDPGFRTFPGPGTIVGTVREYDDRIRIEWSSSVVPGGHTIEYEIWRYVSGADPSTAIKVGATLELAFDDYTAQPGLVYEYSVRGRDIGSGLLGGLSESVPGIRSTVPPYQPDISIGAGGALLGNDIYSRSGAGQTVFQRLKRSKTVSWRLNLENDGIFPDDLRFICAGKDRYFTPTLRETGGAGQNVTGAAVAGLYLLPDTEPDGAVGLSLSLRASRSALNRKVRRLYSLYSLSSSDSEHRDRALAGVKTIPKSRRKKR